MSNLNTLLQSSKHPKTHSPGVVLREVPTDSLQTVITPSFFCRYGSHVTAKYCIHFKAQETSTRVFFVLVLNFSVMNIYNIRVLFTFTAICHSHKEQ